MTKTFCDVCSNHIPKNIVGQPVSYSQVKFSTFKQMPNKDWAWFEHNVELCETCLKHLEKFWGNKINDI